MGSLSVIVPAFNEEESLKTFLPELVSFCRDRGYELIVVNDGSSDSTGTLLEAVASEPFVRAIQHKVNRGYGGAIKSAIREVRTDYLVTVDADGQHVLEDVERLHRLIEEQDADMVVGNRDSIKQGLYRSIGKGLIRWIAKRLIPLQVHDINSGMKIYDTELARRYIRFCPDSMAYSDTIVLMFVGYKHRVTEEPISLRPRTGGQSHITTQTALTTFIELLNVVVLFNPMRIFLPLALVFGLFGVIWNIPILLRGEGVSVGSMMLIVSGLLFFLLGLITESLSNIRREKIES